MDGQSTRWLGGSDRQQVGDDGSELRRIAAFEHVDDLRVIGGNRVAGPPQCSLASGVQPVRVAATFHQFRKRVDVRVVVVVAAVAEHQQRAR